MRFMFSNLEFNVCNKCLFNNIPVSRLQLSRPFLIYKINYNSIFILAVFHYFVKVDSLHLTLMFCMPDSLVLQLFLVPVPQKNAMILSLVNILIIVATLSFQKYLIIGVYLPSPDSFHSCLESVSHISYLLSFPLCIPEFPSVKPICLCR